MDDIPRAVLSEHFQERLSGQRLLAAVFLTYQFDPGFFEQQVLPVFLDIPLSHATPIRLIQLEDALRTVSAGVAVYYDANGLLDAGAGPAKLDVRRVPIRHSTGIFHAKNVILLVEKQEPDDEGRRPRTLLVASLSANLTRSGWWRNVEACHVETVADGDKTSLRDDTTQLLREVKRIARAEETHEALHAILAFLRTSEQRVHKSSDGRLHPQLHWGTESVVDFLDRTAGDTLRGAYLEVIAPYFDDADDCGPLADLVDRFQPREVRVCLPRSHSGAAACRPTLYEAVAGRQDTSWGYLPQEIVRVGRSQELSERFVHAKVYRFFTQSPKREITFVGSSNLTTAAHQRGGNWETGLLVDRIPARRPEFWLRPLGTPPAQFEVKTEDEGAATARATPLCLRYRWDQARAEAFWDAPHPSAPLKLECRGVLIGELQSLQPRVWIELEQETAGNIAKQLEETSLIDVVDGDVKYALLVQEEGMANKPSLLLRLSAADILRYWSLLTADQRAAFLEARAPESALTAEGAELLARAKIVLDQDSLFDRFAGCFHAFGCLERSVREALDDGREKEATYRIFGAKYDSLGALLDRVEGEASTGDRVDQYVIVMCALQLVRMLRKDFPELWEKHRPSARALEDRCEGLRQTVRVILLQKSASDFSQFLKWFDHWFLRRAAEVQDADE